MMESAEKRSRHDPHVPWEIMVGDRGCRQPRRWLRKAGTEAGVRAAAIVVEPPDAKNPPQMLLAEWNQGVQTLFRPR